MCCLDDSHAHILRMTYLELFQQELQQCLCPERKKKKRDKDILLNIKIVINVLIDLILTA